MLVSGGFGGLEEARSWFQDRTLALESPQPGNIEDPPKVIIEMRQRAIYDPPQRVYCE